MINEKKLKKELQKRFDAFVRKCGMADDMKSDGYASCYDDVSDIIEQLAAQNDIEQLSHYIYSHLCKFIREHYGMQLKAEEKGQH